MNSSKSSDFLLSICIPTYNFGKFIGQTLDSILPQLTLSVEVIVLDGGSTDETPVEVAIRQDKFKQLTYYKQSFRGGIDRDIEKVVSLARGKYCWLFSADDVMLPGTINKIIAAIETNYDIYLCEHILCTLDMRPIKAHPPFRKLSAPRLFDLGNASQREEYFRFARTSEAFFSFLSGPVFKKELWESGSNIPDSFRDSCWIVAAHLLSMIPRGVILYYMNEVLIHKRGDNDSFMENGMVNRYAIAVDGYRRISEYYFGKKSLEAFHIRRSICNDLTLKHMLNLKLACVENDLHTDQVELNRLVSRHYLDSTVLNRMKFIVYKSIPISVYRHIKKLNQYLKSGR